MPHRSMKMAELIGALSHALDMTEGQPPGHCVRACWIALQIGKEYGLEDKALWELFYCVLLKDLGCSSNAARICELYATDDLNFKRDFKTVNGSLTQVLNFVLQHTGVKSNMAERFTKVLSVFKHGTEWSTELIQTRCERGADIARQLRFSEAVSDGIRGLDEHWDGSGRPYGLKGEDIPLYSRIALLSQVIDVFYIGAGINACLKEIRLRKGTWFDPKLVEAFFNIISNDFWKQVSAKDLEERIAQFEPAQFRVELDEDYIDQIAAAFGQVVDSKSPYTAGHSERVALITDLIGKELGYDENHRRWLKRGALLHDVGKLGISNSILDKPDRLTDEEYITVKNHAQYTGDILSRIKAFQTLADVAKSHHERLDGKGYPQGLSADEISMDTRIITTADIFDAITAARPYRGPIPVPQALEIMSKELDTQIDQDCFVALLNVTDQLELKAH